VQTMEPATADRRVPFWKSLEFSTLAAIAVVAGAAAAFVKLADEVVEGETRGFDEAILIALRQPGDLAEPIGPKWLEIVFRDLTSLGSTTVLTLLTVIVVGYLLVERNRGAAALVIVATALGVLLSTVLKDLFARPRPELVAHLVDVTTLSFPSGHAMLSAVTYLTLGALLARAHPRRSARAYILGTAVTLTLLVGISRVYLGVHYPTDVLAGWSAGAGWAALCWLISRLVPIALARSTSNVSAAS
jgi:undecaprenyl-diphosphatase